MTRGPMRVLVVDDAADVASLHATFVTAHARCELIGTAHTGPQATAAIRRMQPDLVLLDVFLPGYSGIEVLREVRADAGIVQPEVIAVTAARDVETVREARMMGARHYLVKPFSAQELHERIDEIARERESLPSPTMTLAQDDVDAVMRPGERRTLPKGLTPETLALVSSALAERTDASAADIAEAVGLSRVSCRRYLEHLVGSGVAARSLDYATSGRPGTRYRLVRG
jgi:response regulator of citrate/malate metabolism